MAIKTYEEMNELGLDILKEIGTIGGGNAATALSSMLSTQVQMAVPSVKILDYNAALAILGDPEELVAAIFVEMAGEVSGIMLFVLTKEVSDEILFRMLGKTESDLLAMEEIDSSVLIEIGNIVISSYITAMSSLTGVNVELSVPQLAINMLGGIMSVPIAMMGQHSDKIMMITGDFKIDGKALDSTMLLLPDVESLNVLMKKLGVESVNGKKDIGRNCRYEDNKAGGYTDHIRAGIMHRGLVLRSDDQAWSASSYHAARKRESK